MDARFVIYYERFVNIAIKVKIFKLLNEQGFQT